MPPPDAILEKIRKQIAKKFGGKGGAVVDGNMAVIREGIEATHKVDYDAAAFAEDRRQGRADEDGTTSRSRRRCADRRSPACGGFSTANTTTT